ncbi:hypothetical protein [Roseateles sp.]|uniref:hypothetical protein n=1 Tax=Roseateles sp. TaxID=1971397 RepID=UPI0025E1D73B|nr:hypothetical protein [Roseateles sp.]MBV8035790.1 hypothetical protein [Roseateles sp.]
MSSRIRIVLPDTGPLISLAHGQALELLLAFKADVRIVLTDVVEYEATHRAADLPDANAIRQFLHEQAHRIEVLPTTIGSLALADLRRLEQAGLPAALSKDIGELSITNFVMSLRTVNPGDPTLVLVEDDWFATNAYAVPGNVHLLSTSAWLDGLEQQGLIRSAAEVRTQIQANRPHFRADFKLDQAAEKNPKGSDWRGALRSDALATVWDAAPGKGQCIGPVVAMSDTEIIQSVGRGKHVVWPRSVLRVDTLAVGETVTVDESGAVT